MTDRSGKPDAGAGFAVLELCSYGDSGDFQVLPRGRIEIVLEDCAGRLTIRGGRAAVSDGMLMAETGGTQISLYSDGRAVLERVAPCSKEAALALYRVLLGAETDGGSPPEPGCGRDDQS